MLPRSLGLRQTTTSLISRGILGVLMDPPTVHTLSIPANVCFNFDEDKLESISVLSEEENHDKTIEDVVNTMLSHDAT